jgi:hypothetical protein
MTRRNGTARYFRFWAREGAFRAAALRGAALDVARAGTDAFRRLAGDALLDAGFAGEAARLAALVRPPVWEAAAEAPAFLSGWVPDFWIRVKRI